MIILHCNLESLQFYSKIRKQKSLPVQDYKQIAFKKERKIESSIK